MSFHELADVSEASLQAALDAGPPSVLHLLCHGVAGGAGEPSGLKWGTIDQPSEISAQRLARMLRHHDGALRLVVLSACGSGDGRGDAQLLGSLAQELHRNGIRNVVASRYPLSVSGSQVMTNRVDADQVDRLRRLRQGAGRGSPRLAVPAVRYQWPGVSGVQHGHVRVLAPVMHRPVALGPQIASAARPPRTSRLSGETALVSWLSLRLGGQPLLRPRGGTSAGEARELDAQLSIYVGW